jgi:hypothetical protein
MKCCILNVERWTDVEWVGALGWRVRNMKCCISNVEHRTDVDMMWSGWER